MESLIINVNITIISIEKFSIRLTKLLVSGQSPEGSDYPLIGLELFLVYKILTHDKFRLIKLKCLVLSSL